MDQPHTSNWRDMFERGRANRAPGQVEPQGQPAPTLPNYDDGALPVRQDQMPLSPHDARDAAAEALAGDPSEYRPWTLQRGPRATMMLHLRRFDPRSGLWTGWAVSYSQLLAVEYVGNAVVSLDFYTRQFMLQGRNLHELVGQLQNGTVLCIQEYCQTIWPTEPAGSLVSRIQMLAQQK